MADRKTRVAIASVASGINAYDPPWAIKDDECVDALNVDFYKAPLGRKRGGMATVSLTFSSGGPFTGTVSALFRHVPGTSDAAAELWGIDDAATPVWGRMAGAATFAAPSVLDAITGNAWDVTAVTINGKLFLAYLSAAGRLHLWDGSTVRRAGLRVSNPPTIADTGGGAYAAVARTYRQRTTRQVAGITLGRSEPTAGVAFTPSGAGTAARVTQGGTPGEGETHWEIEASTDGATYYRIATVVIGTTTYDDSAATTSYSSSPLSAATGVYTLQKSYKFIAADQNRILGYGSFTTTDKQARIELSAVIGSSDVGDEERVDTSVANAYLDLDEGDSGVPTGLAGPVLGTFFAFKDKQTWQLTPTGSLNQPYRQKAISKSVGAVTHYAIARGEDADGNASLYWMSHRGPYRWGVNGLEYIGRGIEPFVQGPTATINLAATKVIARTIYHHDKRQVWFFWATSTNNEPDQAFVYDVGSGGWSRRDGFLMRAAVNFANTLGATMSKDLKPYMSITQLSLQPAVWKADTGTADPIGAFQSYVVTKAYEPGGPGHVGVVGDASLLAKAASGVTIGVTVIGDFALQSKACSVLLTAEASETRVIRRVEESGLGNVGFVQYQIGDLTAIDTAWSLDRLVTAEQKQAASAA